MSDGRKEFEKAFPSSKAYRGGTQTGYFEPWSLAFTAWQAARRAALEEAAKACEDVRNEGDPVRYRAWEDNHDDGHIDGCNNCADAIRALAAQTGPDEKRGLSLEEYHARMSPERKAAMEEARPRARQMIADYVAAKEVAANTGQDGETAEWCGYCGEGTTQGLCRAGKPAHACQAPWSGKRNGQ